MVKGKCQVNNARISRIFLVDKEGQRLSIYAFFNFTCIVQGRQDLWERIEVFVLFDREEDPSIIKCSPTVFQSLSKVAFTQLCISVAHYCLKTVRVNLPRVGYHLVVGAHV